MPALAQLGAMAARSSRSGDLGRTSLAASGPPVTPEGCTVHAANTSSWMARNRQPCYSPPTIAKYHSVAGV